MNSSEWSDGFRAGSDAAKAACEHELAALRAERDADKRDAERYRWLRDKEAYVAVQPHHSCLPKDQRTGWTIRLICGNDSDMDAAVDAALRGNEGRKSD